MAGVCTRSTLSRTYSFQIGPEWRRHGRPDRPAAREFRGTLLLGGKTATGIEVPEEVVESLGSGKRPAVRVTIRGHSYRSTIAVMGGKFMLPISAENRAGAGVEAGDVVDVELELDTEPREVNVPPTSPRRSKGI